MLAAVANGESAGGLHVEPAERTRLLELAGRVLDSPNLVLAGTAFGVLCGEFAYRTRVRGIGLNPAWLLAELAVAAVGLLLVWRRQGGLRFARVLAIALVFHVAWLLLHAHYQDTVGDGDTRDVYPIEGDALLHGHYPRSEYPPGAVVLFAFEQWIRSGAFKNANGWLMVPFQLGAVASIWSLRTRLAPWLAALVAVWPANTFYWEFRFDLVPATLAAAGLVLALRERWALAGLAFGIGTAVKWTPSLCFAALALWLVTRRRWRPARQLGLPFAASLVAVHLPFLVTSPHALTAAYTRQTGRGITAESIWYLPLHALGRAGGTFYAAPVSPTVPGWSNWVAIAIQAAAVAALIVAGALLRVERRTAVALAALAPVAFFLTNRIFSPQFLVPILVLWAVAGALLARGRVEQLLIGVTAMIATLANMFVYPFVLWNWQRTWLTCSWILFAAAVAVTTALAARGFGSTSVERERVGRAASPR